MSLKAKPTVNADAIVSLHLEMQLRTLTGQSLNGVPVIANREFQGSLTLMDGEPAVVAGAVTNSEQRSMTGIPGLGAVPGLNQVMTSNSKQEEEDELLIVITPRVISKTGRTARQPKFGSLADRRSRNPRGPLISSWLPAPRRL